jgi:diguanylate cyclase (GGDEF)-like protein
LKRSVEPLLPSYYELIRSLLPGCLGICVLGSELEECGSRGAFNGVEFAGWLRERDLPRPGTADGDRARKNSTGQFEVALRLLDSTGKLIAVVGIALAEAEAHRLGRTPGALLRQRLKPALDCLHRELANAARAKSKVATLSQRTRDLEWLFGVAADLKSAATNRSALQQLLESASQRMRSAYCALLAPAQGLPVEHTKPTNGGRIDFAAVLGQARPHLLAWADRHRRPFVMNGVGSRASKIAPCKLLSVPVTPVQGPAIGVLVFINPPGSADYSKRHAFLAANIARQAAQLLQSQYDLATGLLTRAALEETYKTLPDSTKRSPQAVLHLDIDRLHVVNSVHGHEVGDAVILRMSHLLAPPILAPDALVARIAGDQFVVILPNCDTEAAASVASQLQRAIVRTPSCSLPEGIELTLSCGVSSLVNGPACITTALVAAEAACQAAKERGRNRIETYASNDSSIIRRHGDAIRMLSLEDALKCDRFELYGQPIVPLSDPELPSGYEVLLRLHNEDGSIAGPDEFLPAAHRYQMMPAIDRWVLDHTLNLAESYSGVLIRRQISLSINVTGHSLADGKFVDYLFSRLRSSRLPPRLLTIEMTEQAAVRNMAVAVQLMSRLRAAGCGVALDDFGTGTNSLVYLRDLPVTRVKIDGSFVRDIATNRRAESTLKSIVDLVRPFGVEIVAEYVGNEAIARKARQFGIDYAQGYAFGKPAPLAAVFEGLKQDESSNVRRLALEI